MDESKLRAWWAHRQGLDGALAGKSPALVLERSGWARSVAGINPYLTLFSRAGISREAADAAVARLEMLKYILAETGPNSRRITPRRCRLR